MSHAHGSARISTSAGSVLVDTNVLVYLYDSSAESKQRQALALIAALEKAQRGAVSTQVLSEFFSVTVSKLRNPLPIDLAIEQLDRHARIWIVYGVTTGVILTAARAVRDYRLNFWDAQLWAVAKLNGVDTILSEDFSSGSALEGVRFLNPFDKSFQLRQILA